MPLVTVTYAPHVQEGDLYLIFLAARQIVPAGLHCKEGALKPGDIEYQTISSVSLDYTTAEVIIKIEAMDYPERRLNISQRTRDMAEAFATIFPQFKFAVGVSLSLASWKSTAPNPNTTPWHGDMSMGMATFRARQDINAEVNLIIED
ncbi:MAG TPA: hypothetical protein VN081_04320 [Dongiaceae bacterium]|nr:hypothetical protein [Dongiaceae bacterium]